ncbi:MAG: hypothetical protein ACR2MG_17615 [Pyrinomonadaceae bacterium]
MSDIEAIARGIWGKYRGKPQELAKELVKRCLSEADVVFRVFAILDDYSTLDVGCRSYGSPT